MSHATDDPATDPSSAGEPQDDSGLLAAVGERVRAEAARIVTVTEIALTESRLAGTSALVLLAIVLFGAALSVVIWLLLMALLALGLMALGLGPGGALGILLLVHAAIGAALVWLARQMLANLRFDHTLGALGGLHAGADSSDAERADSEPRSGPYRSD